jgi:superfamily II DNA or RNA helicase
MVKTIRRDTHIWVPEALLPKEVAAGLKRSLTVLLPGGGEFALCHQGEGVLALPRRIDVLPYVPGHTLEDPSPGYEEVPYSDTILLDHRQGKPTGLDVQQQALQAIQQETLGGIIQLYCGAGKTVVALKAISLSQAPALVLVDNRNLLQEWADTAEALLDGPKGWLETKGLESGGLVISTYQTILSRYSKGKLPEELRARFKTVFFDEAHHVSAPNFSQCAEAFSGKRIGLTATPRVDGLKMVADAHLGPVLYSNLLAPLHPRAVFARTRKTKVTSREPLEFSKLAAHLGEDVTRSKKVAAIIEILLEEGRRVAVLSSSVDALVNILAEYLGYPPIPKGVERAAYAMQMVERAQKQGASIGALIAEIPENKRELKQQLMFVVRQFGREGYNDEQLDTVILCEPVRDEGLLQQILGRTLRPFPGKKDALMVCIEDSSVRPMAKLAASMRRLLRDWPLSKGGAIPFTVQDLDEQASVR